MSSENDNIFKPPQRITRSRSRLLKNAKLKNSTPVLTDRNKRRIPVFKNRTKLDKEVSEKRFKKSGKSATKIDEELKKQFFEQPVGVLTRNRSRSLLQKLDITQEKKKNILREFCTDSGYGTSSDTSKECAESVASESRESLESEVSESNRLVSPSTCLEGNPLSSKIQFADIKTEIPDGKHNCESLSFKNEKLNKDINDSDTPEITLLIEKGIKAMVPKRNINNYSGPFKIKIEDHQTITRESLGRSMRIHKASPVVSVEPHGVHFYQNWPAILVIPLKVEPRNESWLCCFYSATNPQSSAQWEQLPKKDYVYRNGCLVITTCHFSVFTVMIEEPYPEILKKIRCRTGGRLRIRDVPGIEVHFPRGCLEHDIDACLRVMFDNEPSLDNSSDVNNCSLASPIISLGPHGLDFNRNRLPVLISLPIPNYQEIMSVCPNAKLIAYESSTADGEPMVWKKIDFEIPPPNVIAYRHGICGTPIPVVTFPVYHFSFFKVIWELLQSTLYEAKMGITYFYPYISFSMMCQAFMEESHENDKFALEVICYRSDRKLPEVTNYRYRVGASLKPKLVRPGRILVSLRSQMFEADIEAGEDEEMKKEEPDFRGRDFEKQYACKFKPQSKIEKGTFGKVIIERISTTNDRLFEFNLYKAGTGGMQVPPPEGCDRWVMYPMREMAASLNITQGSNWKQMARILGFNNSEIDNMLGYAPDPFVAMMDIYNSRGGTFEEFVQATYMVSRELNGHTSVNSANDSQESVNTNSSNNSGASGSQDSPMQKIWKMRPWGRQPDSDSAESKQGGSGLVMSDQKRMRPGSSSNSGNPPKRRKFSDTSETAMSTSTEDEVEIRKPVSDEKYRNSTRKLRDKDLWRISLGIARRDWRNLGRTLGIEEIVLINIEHSHQSVGFRECAYQMLLEWKNRKPKKCTFGELYTALLREKMVSVSKFMISKIQHSDEYKSGYNSDSD